MTTAIFVAVCGLVYYGWSSFKTSTKPMKIQVDSTQVDSTKASK